MSVSINACPSCKSLVLPDTAQCPNCHYIFDQARAADSAPAPPAAESPEEEVPCPGCNELVRKGLVRCWNCGTFMRQEIAETYRQMQIAPPRVIYSEIREESDEPSNRAGGSGGSSTMLPAPDDADFEVSVEMDETEAGRDFDLGDAPAPSASHDMLESAPVFLLPKEPEPEKSPEDEAKKAQADRFDHRFGGDEEPGATGEGLLRVALAEEAEIGRRRTQKHGEGGTRGGFKVYCPNGHRIEVQERHRGLTGRCPRCRESFMVPANTWDEEQAKQDDETQKVAAAAAAAIALQNPRSDADQQIEISAGEYTRWMLDAHLHVVDLTKLKLKAGSLLKDFQEADVAFAPDGFLVLNLLKKGGLLGGGEKKKLANRDLVLDHLSKGKGQEDLPGVGRQFFAASVVAQLRIVQPIVSSEQSMFAGVPVFGEGRIAVRLPKLDEAAHPQFLSFTLSEFRRFSNILAEFYGVQSFGEESGVPLKDAFTERRCHYSELPVMILEHLEYYKNDPTFTLKLSGRKCAGCGLVVSEESREKEKLGGPNGKKIAKAKCPKCQKPFGDLPLYTLENAPEPLAAT